MAPSKMLTPLAFALSFFIPAVVNAGCFSNSNVWLFNEDHSNFKFGHLHSSPYGYADYATTDVDEEIATAINEICDPMDGVVAGKGQSISKCTEWDYLQKTQQCMLIDCPGKCDANDADCRAACQDECPEEVKDVNHLVFEMKHHGDTDDDLTMTSDLCKQAYTHLFDTCFDYGGDTVGDGFYFKLDPSPFSCDHSSGTLTRLIGSAKGLKSSKKGGKRR